MKDKDDTQGQESHGISVLLLQSAKYGYSRVELE